MMEISVHNSLYTSYRNHNLEIKYILWYLFQTHSRAKRFHDTCNYIQNLGLKIRNSSHVYTIYGILLSKNTSADVDLCTILTVHIVQ